jgi:hypothetical protein
MKWLSPRSGLVQQVKALGRSEAAAVFEALEFIVEILTSLPS